MTIEEIQQEVIEEFEGFDDWMDKYQMLIDLGSEQEPLPEQYKVESNLIDGCQSRVWLQADLTPVLIRVLDNQTPDDILNADLHFIEDIGLKEHLSPTRSNGLLAMMKQMKMYAIAFKAQQHQ